MRWPVKDQNQQRRVGDRRVRKRFAWWPTRVGDEWAVLETYYQEEDFQRWQTMYGLDDGWVCIRRWLL